MMPMLRSTLKGLENVLESDIPQGSVVLVIGAEGALKSGFVFNIMSSYLKAHDGEHGLYVTLEQTSESHLRNMDSLA